MTTHAAFEDFFRLLNEHGVEYMIVGGYAVAYHGFPRFTKEIDVFYANSRSNAIQVQTALVAFDEARPNVVRGQYGAVEVPFIGKEDLLRNKRSTGRQRDMADIEELS